LKRFTGSDTGSSPRNRLSLRVKLFLAILLVALVCVAASAVLSNVLSQRQIGEFVREQGLETPATGTAPGSSTTPYPPGAPGAQPAPGSPGTQVPGQPPPPPPRPRNINLSFLLAGALGLVLALTLSYTLAGRISRPLSKLTAAARRITGGNYGERLDVGGGVEVAELEDALNSLTEGLQRNEKLRSNMVEDIAHELRNPLATLRGQLEMLQAGRIECDRELADSLMEDALLLSRLVEDLRQLSLVEAGQLELDIQPVAVDDAVREVLARFETEASTRGVPIGHTVASDLPAVMADRLRLAQVLGNLVGNSLTHTPAGGSVTVGASLQDGAVVLSVSDTGAGISAEELPFIFERFYRADRSRARATGGAGLGLSIARSLVEAQGGQIWAESETGEGTTIFFTLPAVT
jgi:two-component system, OmpR family, sensor histidine kinase BaeS